MQGPGASPAHPHGVPSRAAPRGRRGLVVLLLVALNAAGIVWIREGLRDRGATVRVLSFRPSGEADPTSPVVVAFDRDVLPDGADVASAPGELLRLVPGVPGRTRWDGSRTLVFEPAARFPRATPFRVVLSPRVGEPAGLRLVGRREFTFWTEPLRLVRARQTGFTRDLRATLRLEFNDRVDPGDVTEHLELLDARDEPVAYDLLPSGRDDRVDLRTRSEVRRLVAVLRPGLRGTGGPLGIDSEVRIPVPLHLDLKVRDVSSERVFRGHPPVRVRFDRRVDPERAGDLAAFVRIDPPLEVRATATGGGEVIRLDGAFRPRSVYEITLRRGLSGRGGAALVDDVTRTLRIPPRQARARFVAERGYVVPRDGAAVPVVHANVPRARLRAAPVPLRNLVHRLALAGPWYDEHFLGEATVHELELPGERDEVVEGTVELLPLLGRAARGPWALALEPLGEDGEGAVPSRCLVGITDLGLVAHRGRDAVLVWAVSITRGRPVPDAGVRLISGRNRIAGEGTTDEDGLARIALQGDERPTRSGAPARYVAVARAGDDVSWLGLAADAPSGRPAGGGRPRAGGAPEAYLWPERSAVAPGDPLRVHAVVRDASMRPPGELPVRLELSRPDRRVFRVLHAELDAAGGAGWEVSIPEAARTGRYRAALRRAGSGPVLGRTSFRVELSGADTKRSGSGAARRATQEGTASSATKAWERAAGRSGSGEGLALRVLPGIHRGGSTARVEVRSPFPGALLVTVETDRVHAARVVPRAGSVEVLELPLPVVAAGDVHVVATAVRGAAAGGAGRANGSRSPEGPGGSGGTAGGRPRSAHGTARVTLDRTDEELVLALDAPPRGRPGRTAAVRVRVGKRDGTPVPARVVVYAVDERSLAAGSADLPDPWGFFYGPRALEVAGADGWGRLLARRGHGTPARKRDVDAGDIDAGEADPDAGAGAIRTGRTETGNEPGPAGGAASLSGSRAGPRSSLLPLSLGEHATGPGGEVLLDLVPPDGFTGHLRLVAVAHAGARCGTASRPVAVRAPVRLELAGMPRVAVPGDRFVVRAGTGSSSPTGEGVELRWSARGALRLDGDGASRDAKEEMPEAGASPAGEAAAVRATARRDAAGEAAPSAVSARAGDTAADGGRSAGRKTRTVVVGPGSGRATLEVRAPGRTQGAPLGRSRVELTVRAASSPVRRVASGAVRADRPLRRELAGGFLPGTAHHRVVLGARVDVDILHALADLIACPHRGLEATVSRAFPVLRLADRAALLRGPRRAGGDGPLGPEGVPSLIRSAVARTLALRLSSGAFSAWPRGGTAWPWGSVYATHFLVEARAAGYAVPAQALDDALSYLEHRAASRDAPAVERAYAARVLARASRPASRARVDELARAAQGGRLDGGGVSEPSEARAFIAAALWDLGEPERARELLGDTLSPMPSGSRERGGTLDTPVREAAVRLAVLVDVEPESDRSATWVERLRGAREDGRWATTQETAFALLALGRWATLEQARRESSTALVRLGDGSADAGDERILLSASDCRVLEGDLSGRTLEIDVQGAGSLHWRVDARGVPATGGRPDAADHGMEVRRRYLDARWEPLRAGPGGVPQVVRGERVLVEIRVRASRRLENIAVVDRLPAGLRLAGPSAAAPRDALARPGDGPDERDGPVERLAVEYVDVRDDRVFVYGSLAGVGTAVWHYAARAVASGEFTAPPVRAECIYDPSLRSRRGSGRLRVLER